ncbi:MAG: hypothetical protein ABW049_06250 [Spongiibacteraceae bacterium]
MKLKMVMDWVSVANDWDYYRAKVKARWGKLGPEHIDVIAGDRAQLAAAIRDVYGIGSADVENQIQYFEARNQDYRPETSSCSRWRSFQIRR